MRKENKAALEETAMAYILCPRCELNYIEESEGYCKICKQEMMGDISHDEPEMCTICNERRAMPGKDICYLCYKEMNEANNDNSDLNDGEEQHQVSEDALMENDPVSSMDEIMPEINDDIPGSEYQQINDELSLEAMGEDEEEDEDEDDESV